MGKLRQKLCGGRRDDDFISPARQFDVTHRGFGRFVPQVCSDRLSGYSLEGQRRHELLRAARHHDLYVGPTIDETPYEIRALVRGDAAGNAEQNLAGWLRTHGRNYGRGRWIA